MKTKIRKYLLWFSIYYASFYILQLFIIIFTNLTLTNNGLKNILGLGMFLLPLLPFIWFSYVKTLWLKIGVYFLYSLLVLAFLSVAWLAIFFITFDVIDNTGNGFRSVYEHPIHNNQWLVIYRTPDQGALGGDHICPAIVKKIVPGLINRRLLAEDTIIFDGNNDSNYVVVDGITYRVPKEEVLRQYGNLR